MSMKAEWGDITVEEIIPSIKGRLVSGSAETALTGISTDSRRILPGQLFLALKGERYDGHDFMDRAIERGASAVIAERVGGVGKPYDRNTAFIEVQDSLKALGDLANWWRRQHRTMVVGITGSAGKTTTKEMTSSILSLGARTLKNEGNLNNLIGLPLTLLRLENGDRRVVLEMGMNRPGEIGRLTEISEPDIGLITNVAKVHLEGLGDIKGVLRAKIELLERMSPNSKAVLYGDDHALMKEASRFKGEIISYGLRPGNDISAANISNFGSDGISFDLTYHGKSESMKIKVPGLHNLLNALAAASIAIGVDESMGHIKEGLGNYKGIKGRLSLIPLPADVILVDDSYNSNPYSLKAALTSVKEIAGSKRRIIVGLGEMMELGEETLSAHREAGEMVAEIDASYFLVMGRHADDMITGAVNKGFPPERIRKTESHEEMAQKIRGFMHNNDLILLKGSRKMGLEKVSETLQEMWSKENGNV